MSFKDFMIGDWSDDITREELEELEEKLRNFQKEEL